MRTLVALSILLLSTANVYAGDTNITIYSSARAGSISADMYRPTPLSSGQGWGYNQPIPGYAIVREKRDFDLKSGINQVSFKDVAAFIEPTTVSFKSLTDPDTSVIEQSFNFDLVNTQKLIEKYVGQEITVEQSLGNTIQSNTGKLLSASGGLIIQDSTTNKVSSISSYSNIKFPELPSGLITKPTLLWSVSTKKEGKHNIETSYQTSGITWWADYIGTFEEGKDANSGTLDLAAWVSIINKAGVSFNDAKLKLVAGDVQQVQAPNYYGGRAQKVYAADVAAEGGFAEQSFFEYHLYTLGRNITIPENSTKQIELFPKANKVPVTKEYLYYGASQPFYGYVFTDRGEENTNKKVDVLLKFKNSDKSNLGMPLPAGKIRVNQPNTQDGSMEFIGEDIVDHTPKDEEVKIKLGNAFDIVGERKQVNYFVDSNRKYIEETIEITLRNHKKEDVKIKVKENLYRAANWKIADNNLDFEKENSNTISFNVPVKKDGTAKVQYKVTYTW